MVARRFSAASIGTVAAIALFVLPAWSSRSLRVSTLRAVPRQTTSACSKRIVYAVSYDLSIYMYDQEHNAKMPCGSVTGFKNPQGIFVDRHRNLWVADQAAHAVYEFAPGNPTPIKTLQDTVGSPVDVAVNDRTNTAYVSNFVQGNSQPGAIEVYAHGSTTPTSTLTDPYMTYAFYDALDDQGNLYVTFLHTNGPTGVGGVDEWIGGSGTAMNLGITLQAPGGIQTTSTGALLICDQALPACGDFAPGSTTMTDAFATKDIDPFAIALDRDERHAFIEDTGSGQLQRWAYPGPDTRPQQRIAIPSGAYAGVAASPASPPGLPY
ncbi:MAG: hypothetical protein JO060_02770 [Candidatus Eremiobacteraeota bacterium]|nr:hypothetical protein [Candidatus Eremiobacteraeota bacterium]MBV9647372.1 hypothetical protein [Candidatus Eremiobacteraeota bacterium]